MHSDHAPIRGNIKWARNDSRWPSDSSGQTLRPRLDDSKAKQYRSAWDEGRKIYRDAPLHDWTSHGADALRYLFTGLKKTEKASWSQKVMNFTVDWMP